MSMPTVPSVRRRIRVVAVAVLVTLVAACSGDDATAPDDALPPVSSVAPPTTAAPETGGIDVPDLPGTFPAALPSLGFGVAVPERWQATVLSSAALERLEDADLEESFFLDAARTVAASGAVFYAAGVDSAGRVAELKIDVAGAAGRSPIDAATDAGAVLEGDGADDVTVVEGGAEIARVDYRADLTSAEDGESISVFGSQLFVADGERLWSLIITSERRADQSVLLEIFTSSFVLD